MNLSCDERLRTNHAPNASNAFLSSPGSVTSFITPRERFPFLTVSSLRPYPSIFLFIRHPFLKKKRSKPVSVDWIPPVILYQFLSKRGIQYLSLIFLYCPIRADYAIPVCNVNACFFDRPVLP